MSDLTPERFHDQADEDVPTDWNDHALWERVRETLFALPSYFRMDGSMPNIPARDLHAANTLLGAAIEDHVPVALNQLRSTWDPESRYADCVFRRQPQTFPDVLLRRETTEGAEILFGIEVKSWYILGREKEPSFRMEVNRRFCGQADLVAIFPWAFSAAISGTPRLFRPLVLSARKAARLRNEYWMAKARDESWREIIEPEQEAVLYPPKTEKINDVTPADKGNKNFGRISRSGVWDQAIKTLLSEETIAGIPLSGWQAFLGAFKESVTLEEALRTVAGVRERLGAVSGDRAAEALAVAAEALNVLATEIAARPRTEAKTMTKRKK